MRRSLALATLLTMTATPSWGQGSDQVSREELLRLLAERDAAIISLEQRLRALEASLQPSAPATPAPAPETQATAPEPASPSTAPGQIEVDPALAARALERSLSESGTLLLPAGIVEVQPSITFVRSDNDLGSMGGTAATQQSNLISPGLDIRIGLPYDFQAEFGASWDFVRQDTELATLGVPSGESRATGIGFGGLRIGLARTFLREEGFRPDLVGRVTWEPGIGSAIDDGVLLGNQFQSIGGEIAVVKRQDPIAFTGTLGYERLFEEDSIRPGAQTSASLGASLAVSPETSLNLTASALFTDDVEFLGADIPGSDTTQILLSAGASTIIAPDTLLTGSFGFGVTDDAPDFTFVLSLPIRFNASGLFQ